MAWLKLRIFPLWILIILGFAGQPWGHATPTAKARPASQATPQARGSRAARKTNPGPPSQAPERPIPQVGKTLIGTPTHIADALVYAVHLPGSEILSSLLWSADGHYLYALEKSGILHKIAVPSFKEERIIKLGQSCNAMALSQMGLVVGLPAAHQVWLVNANSLAVLKKIPVTGVEAGVASAPTLSTAYASATPSRLSVIDLKAGKVAQRITPDAMAQASGGRVKQPVAARLRFDFYLPTVSPDGKYLFCVSDASTDNVLGTLQRFRIRQNELEAEEVGPIIGRNPQRIEISADSSYVALPSRSGNLAQSYATTIYRVEDLANPVTTIISGTYPHALSFDRAAGKIYAHNLSEQLLVFSAEGALEHGYQLGTDGSEVRQLLAHPSAHGVLVLTEKSLFWVVLPTPSNAGGAPQPLTVAAGVAPSASSPPVTHASDWLGTGGWPSTGHTVTPQPSFHPIAGSVGNPTDYTLGELFYNSINKHYYGLVKTPEAITWENARKMAESQVMGVLRGHLATLTTSQEAQFVATHFPVAERQGFWIGGYLDTSAFSDSIERSARERAHGPWKWVTGEPWDYSSWAAGEPNGSFPPADYAELTASGQWNDTFNTEPHCHAFIIEYDSLLPLTPGSAKPPSGSASAMHAASGSVDMEITVDGIEHVHIQGNAIWLTHHAWDLPCCVKINGKERNLTWLNNVSGKWDDLAVPLPASGTLKSFITIGQTAGPVALEQAPQDSNAYEAIIQIDDGVPHGAHPYAFTFSWQTVPNTNTQNR